MILIFDKDKGNSVFSTTLIKKGNRILNFYGSRFKLSEIPKSSYDYYLQVDRNEYIGPSNKIDDFINHSCEPNAYVVIDNTAWLKALRDIMPNEEITFDYSVTSTESFDTFKLDCYCGSPICRKIISGYNTLPTSKKSEYEKLGIVPKYQLF